MKIELSIIIPTYNRKDYLAKMLKILLNQTAPRSKYEIIVVDDGSTDSTDDMISEMKRMKMARNLIYLRKNNAGPAAARNYAARYARGKYLGFIDDDCVPGKEWVEGILSGFERFKDASGIGSAITPVHDEPIFKALNKRLTERKVTKDFYWKFSTNHPGQIISTDNCAVKRSVFDKLHGFSTKFHYAGEDPDFWYRFRSKGYILYFVEMFPVKHKQRAGLMKLMKRSFLFGVADAINYKDNFHKMLYIQPTDSFSSTIFIRFPFTVCVSRNNLAKLIIALAVLAIFFPLISVFLAFAFILLRYFGAAGMRISVLWQSYFNDVIYQFPNLAGRAYGSIRNGVLVL